MVDAAGSRRMWPGVGHTLCVCCCACAGGGQLVKRAHGCMMASFPQIGKLFGFYLKGLELSLGFSQGVCGV